MIYLLIHPPKLVVNSLFTPDSVFTLYVAQTRSFNDQLQSDTILWVNDAVCSLYVDGSFLEVLQNTGEGRYVSPSAYRPQAGHQYGIAIWHKTLGKAEAQSSVPQLPHLLEFKKQDTAVYLPDLLDFDIPDGSPSKLGRIDLSYSKGGSDYLQIISRQTYAGYWIYGCWNCHQDSLIVAQRLVPLYLPQQQENIFTYNFTILVDCKDTVEHLSLFSDEYFLPYSDYLFKNISLELRGLSKEMFAYYKSLTRISESTVMGNYEPVTYYSNVEGGYGIFAGYSSVFDTISYPVSLDSVVLEHLDEWESF